MKNYFLAYHTVPFSCMAPPEFKFLGVKNLVDLAHRVKDLRNTYAKEHIPIVLVSLKGIFPGHMMARRRQSVWNHPENRPEKIFGDDL